MEGVEESQCNARGADAVGRDISVRPALTTKVVAACTLALAAGLALRLWMLYWLFEVNGDSLIYGGIAKTCCFMAGMRWASMQRPGRTVGCIRLCCGCRGIHSFWLHASGCLESRITLP